VFRLEQELAIASLKAGRALECEEKFSDALASYGLECVKLAKREDGDGGEKGRRRVRRVRSARARHRASARARWETPPFASRV
jgi:hypothetical protein